MSPGGGAPPGLSLGKEGAECGEMNRGQKLRAKVRAYRRPFRVPLRTARGLITERRGWLVRIEEEDGTAGYGEAAPLEFFGTETLADAEWFFRSLEAAGTFDLHEALDWAGTRRPCCRFALASAAERRAVPDEAAGRQPFGCSRLLPAGEASRPAVEEGLAAGFGVFKLKVGLGDPVQEQRQVETLCGLLPEWGRLRLDANGAWTPRLAADWLAWAMELPIAYVEQPLPREAEADLTQLDQDFPGQVALDESVVTSDDLKAWRDRGWRGTFVIKPALAGDPSDLLEEIAGGPGDFVFSSALETAVGARASLAVAQACPWPRHALGFGVEGFFEEHDPFGGWTEVPVQRDGLLAGKSAEQLWELAES
ncbi:MAG: o-succinylbenzoate synthase [Puniceicoccaceae bacterium]|nr:MAG: o-succinylbenzoate synthase [Puniceicoccaceae bacterium]